MKRTLEEQLRDMSYETLQKVTGDLALDSETKQRIYAKTLRRIGVASAVKEKEGRGVPHHQRRLSLKKPAVAAAAVLLALSLGVGSIVGAGSITKSFGQIFHSLPESRYRDLIFDINQSQTDNGVTVTLSQGMCDGTALYLIERVEFDPSIVTLSDGAIAIDKEFGMLFFATDNVAHGKNDRLTVERGFSKLLEYDAHSMTWLVTYGGGTSMDNADDFFRTDRKIVLTKSTLDNLPGHDTEIIDCRFQFEFNLKLCEPTVYNLPDKAFTYDENVQYPGYENEPDVWLNPWYMHIAPACITGKVIDTSLAGDEPALEITLNDGTVYSDGHGILVGGNPFKTQDLFGKDYSIYRDIYCTFDTEVDVTSIRSIKLFGCEMTKASVPAPQPVEKKDSVKQELTATDPITFPKNETTFEVTEFKVSNDPEKGLIEKNVPTGSMKYRIKDIGVYDNLYAAGAIREDILNIMMEDGKFLYYDEDGVLYGKSFQDACDIESGKLSDKFYLVEYEIELTNIDSPLYEFEQNFFNMELYCDHSDMPDEVDTTFTVGAVYIKENDRKTTGRNDTFTLEKGQTRTLHIGFIVNDNNRGSLSQLGMRVGGQDIPFVNIVKAVENLKNNDLKL